MTDLAPCHYSGKLSYASEREANASRVGISLARKSRNGGPPRQSGPLQSFKCRECGNWHLGRPRTNQNPLKRKGA